MAVRYQNPILPGFYPDPSICRVGEDFYLVTSTFSYFPGVPIFHSKDLIHYEQIGNVLTRKEQLNLTDTHHSGGIYAPTLRYHNGTYYMITTNINHGGNFIVTATNPAGPWSNPYYLDGADGIDPSLFFDDDGRCYYTGTKGRRDGAKFFGDNEIYVQELDIKNMRLIGESYPIWHGALRNVEWAEGPHIYKKDDYYYLLISEAGTGHNHAITVSRSKDIAKPFHGYEANPILTHRHLGVNYPIVNVGHGDLVQVHENEWYMVLLASRPYGGYYRNLGRETFLAPVTWENGWPVVNYGIGLVENTVLAPNLPIHKVPPLPEKEDFEEDTLPYHFIYLRNPNVSAYSLTDKRGYLRLTLKPEMIHEKKSPTFVGVRQTSMNFSVTSQMDFSPLSEHECAGLVIIQSNDYYYQMTLTIIDGIKSVALYKCENGIITLINKIPYSNSSILLNIIASGQDLTFSYCKESEVEYKELASNVDGRILSTDVAGGFVGTCIGMYASSNGMVSDNQAYFDYFTLN